MSKDLKELDWLSKLTNPLRNELDWLWGWPTQRRKNQMTWLSKDSKRIGLAIKADQSFEEWVGLAVRLTNPKKKESNDLIVKRFKKNWTGYKSWPIPWRRVGLAVRLTNPKQRILLRFRKNWTDCKSWPILWRMSWTRCKADQPQRTKNLLTLLSKSSKNQKNWTDY